MKQLLAILFVAVFASMSFAQEAATMEKELAPAHVESTKKLMKSVTLTAEQETAMAAAAENLTSEIAELKERGVTQELIKTIEDKRAEGREAGLKGKALQAQMVADLSEEEAAAYKDYRKALNGFDVAVAKMLTEEQMGELPRKVNKRMMGWRKAKQGKGGKGKKKKKADAMADDAAADAAE